MPHNKKTPKQAQDFMRVESNQELVLRLFRAYYRAHQTSGKLFDDFPDFFLVKPIVLKDADIIERASDKLIVEDCVQRAVERKGFVGVSKWRNPKLNYYWLGLSVFPFMLGDDVTQNNEGEFYYVLQHFIAYTHNHPKQYGDMTGGADHDQDMALMLNGIAKRAARMQSLLPHYPIENLVELNPNWPLDEVHKLLQALKGSDLDWCDLFFEHIIYVMGNKREK